MKQRDQILVGLDIGTTKVCVLAGELGPGGNLKVVGFGQAPSDGIRKGVIIDIEKTVHSIRQALRECELMLGESIKEVLTGIAGHHIHGINTHGMVTVHNNRTVSEEDIKRVIAAAQAVNIPNDREVLHILPQDFIVDDQDGVQNPLGMMGIRLEVDVHIVTGSATSAQNITKCCALSGLEVGQIVLEPLASATAVLSRDEKELGVVLVDIGGGTSDIAIYSAGSIVHTSVLALGGNHLTNDIAIGLSTPLADAETLKHQHGVAMNSMAEEGDMIEVASVGGRKSRLMEKKLLANIIESRLTEIFEMVSEEIDRSKFRHVIASGVVITGGCSILPGAEELAAKTLQLPARVGTPENISGLSEIVCSPMYATGVGLLRHGLEQRETVYHPTYAEEMGAIARLSRKMKEWMQEIF